MRRDRRDPPSVTAVPRHVYVHVPFCARRCSYCDFAISVRRTVPVDAYVDGLAAELEIRFPDVGAPWPVETLYLGGGTPSALGAAGVERLLGVLYDRLTLNAGAEVTLEANPEDVTGAAVAAWRAAGVNRVSVGVQSFHAGALMWMHCEHSATRAVEAIESLRAGGIRNVSADLDFRAADSARSIVEERRRVAALARLRHVSLYGLTVEPGTALDRWVARRVTTEAPEEAYEEEYLAAHDAFTAAAYDHYEVSNFARSGYQACHNRAYWAGVPYAGLGPAAHEYDGEVRRWNVAGYTQWLATVKHGRDPIGGSEQLTPSNRVSERVYLALRTATGAVLTDEEMPLVRPWLDAGWGRLDEGRLVLTALGWLRLDSLAVALAEARTH